MSDINSILHKGLTMKKFINNVVSIDDKNYHIHGDMENHIIIVDDYVGSDNEFHRLLSEKSVAPVLMNWWGFRVRFYADTAKAVKIKSLLGSYLEEKGIISSKWDIGQRG